MQQAKKRKEVATVIMEDATFKLHKWSSNVSTLKDNNNSEAIEDKKSAKQQLAVTPQGCKILGLP